MSLAKRIIPCLDVKNGRVVKGTKFKNLVDAGDPVEVAKIYDAGGADELVFLDITASHEERKTILDVVEKTASSIFMPLTVGGGVKTLEDIRNLLQAGADKVSINTSAVYKPSFVKEASQRFGSSTIVVAIDAKKVGDSWEIFTHGGRQSTGINAIDWAIRMEKNGAGELLLTSMDRDGTQNGYDVALLAAMSEKISIPVIASGGVGDIKHFHDAFAQGKADAALAASVFHFGKYSVKEVKEYLKNQGVAIRL